LGLGPWNMEERSDEERERARLEREARRAGRADRAVATATQRPPRPKAQGPTPDNGDRPQRPVRRPRTPAVLGIGLLILVVAVLWFLVSLYQPSHGSGHGRVSVTIPRGGGLSDIARRLDSAGVISSKFFFELRARVAGHTSDLKPGIYAMRKDMSYS